MRGETDWSVETQPQRSARRMSRSVNVPNSGSPPSRRRPDTGPLRRGRWFHEQVQTAFLADVVGAEATPEYTMTLLMSRRGRVDLLILPQGDERMAVVVEIKSTDWDA